MFVLGSDVEGAFTERRIQRGGQILGGEDKDDMFWIGWVWSACVGHVSGDV